MIKWKTTKPTDRSGLTYYDEREVICSKPLLVKYRVGNYTFFAKATYIPCKKEWQDWESFQLENVIGWYDLKDDLK
jgi:hypothetical protein